MAVVLIAAGYLLGGIPTGVLVGRFWGVDVQRVGSGNIGATNVLRALGIGSGALVLVLDLLKGALPVLAARVFLGDGLVLALVGTAAVAGHVWSPYLRFRGGKGVATGLGTLLALVPIAGLIALVVGVLVIALSRYVSLGSIAGTLVGAALACASVPLAGAPWPVVPYALVSAAIIVARHRENIERLRAGREPSLSLAARRTPSPRPAKGVSLPRGMEGP
jgi:glycerol-3-phosphate acyltransferase PlsY